MSLNLLAVKEESVFSGVYSSAVARNYIPRWKSEIWEQNSAIST